MEKDQPKKCFCARCFLPIEDEDKVDIGGQNFHRMCSTCCVCRQIPKTMKMFYGHVFCADCFKAHVLGQFKGESPCMHSCSWWSQSPGMKPQENAAREKEAPDCKCSSSEEPSRKCICSRCLQSVDTKDKVDIGVQHFHPECARCYFCHTVPKSNLKIYYGQVFCEECFNRHVLNRNRDNPSEFFRTCFEQWQNVQFAEGMRQFMGCNKEGCPPFVFCHSAGADGSKWGAQPDTRRCRYLTTYSAIYPPYSDELKYYILQPIIAAVLNVRKTTKTVAAVTANIMPSSIPEDDSLEDLYFENRTEMSDIPEPFNDATSEVLQPPAAEKIEKLTKYLHDTPSVMKSGKKWKNFVEVDKISLASFGWVDLQERLKTQVACPKCLWQCGPIYVSSAVLKGKCVV